MAAGRAQVAGDGPQGDLALFGPGAVQSQLVDGHAVGHAGRPVGGIRARRLHDLRRPGRR